MSEYKKTKHNEYLNMYDDYKNQDLLRYPKHLKAQNTWWRDGKKKDNLEEMYKNIEKVFQNKPTINEIIPSGGEKIKDIPQQMGSFETKAAGTVMVGYDRFKSASDLVFTVVSDKDKNQQGIPERDKFAATTYFGANYDGEEKNFKAGPLSFRYFSQSEELKKMDDKNYRVIENSKKDVIYDCEKEEKAKENLEKGKKENPEKAKDIHEKEEKIEKIKDKKEKKNEEFLDEIEEFNKGRKSHAIKEFTEADELMIQRKRIAELARRKTRENIKTDEKEGKKENLELARKINLIKRIVKFVEEVAGKEEAERTRMDLFSKARIKSIGMNEFVEIIKETKRRYNIK